MAFTATSSIAPGPYAGWTREQLVERLAQLEGKTDQLQDVSLGAASAPISTSRTPAQAQRPKQDRPFDFSKHSRRKIALKFCYSGWEYSGLAFQNLPSTLPTVENVLYDVMVKAHLIDPAGGTDGCGWEKCGRTDAGVSSAGQVISLWIRSNLPLVSEPSKEAPTPVPVDNPVAEDAENLNNNLASLTLESESLNSSVKIERTTERRRNIQEIDYVGVLNRLLPDTIRVIAWSPVSDSFSARFSCKYRHYKYFFFSLHLDIPRMEDAASRLIGEHDFRNLCKLDVQKQITRFKRKIISATISPLEDADGTTADSPHGRMYVFDLMGTAFLYHQVRHIMAALFMVGSGLEPPEVITELMNVEEGAEALRPDDIAAGKQAYAVVDSKPDYQMADALPLMLWDCAYDEADLDWRTHSFVGGEEAGSSSGETGGGDLFHQIQGIYSRSRVYSALDSHFASAIAKHHPSPSLLLPLKNGLKELDEHQKGKAPRDRVITLPLGGGTFKRLQKYKPLLTRKRLDTVEVMNERWRTGKGFRRDEKKKAAESAGDVGDE